MRTQKIKVRVGNSVVTFLENGNHRIRIIRTFREEVPYEKAANQ